MPELYLVRHAQASFGADDYDNLSDLGHQQSRWLGEHFAAVGITFDHFINGSMKRHRQTCEGILEGMDVDPATVTPAIDAGLNEYDFQALMRAYTERFPDDALVVQTQQAPEDKKVYYRLLRLVLNQWQNDNLGTDIPESWSQFKGRVEAAVSAIQTTGGSGDRVLVVSSGGAISTAVGLVLGIPDQKIFDLNLQIKNTSIAQFFYNRDKVNFAGFNSTPHLESVDRLPSVTYG